MTSNTFSSIVTVHTLPPRLPVQLPVWLQCNCLFRAHNFPWNKATDPAQFSIYNIPRQWITSRCILLYDQQPPQCTPESEPVPGSSLPERSRSSLHMPADNYFGCAYLGLLESKHFYTSICHNSQLSNGLSFLYNTSTLSSPTGGAFVIRWNGNKIWAPYLPKKEYVAMKPWGYPLLTEVAKRKVG